MNCPPAVLFSGYYGFGNTGDEAILQASVGLLRARCPEIEIAALSADPAATAAAYGIRAYHRTRPREVITALREADMLLSGGGSLLQDRTSLRSLVYYLGIVRLALAMRRRVMIFAQGIGPLARPQARRLTGSLLARASAITVRDPASRELLHSLPGSQRMPPIQVTADPAFALEPQETDEVSALFGGARSSMSLVAVNLRPWPGMENTVRAIGEAIRLNTRPLTFLSCPLQPGEDGPLCRRLAAVSGARVVEEPLSPREWRALLGGADLVLAARLHALILAAAGGVPTVAIEYDPKVTALRARIDGASLGEPAAIAAREVTARLRDNYGGESGRAARLGIAADLREQAARNAEVALEVLRP